MIGRLIVTAFLCWGFYIFGQSRGFYKGWVKGIKDEAAFQKQLREGKHRHWVVTFVNIGSKEAKP